MERRKLFASSLGLALPEMPSVLCTLISEYGYQRPHSWRSEGMHELIKLSNLKTEVTVELALWRRIKYLFNILLSGKSPFGAQLIVSSSNMDEGDWNWSITLGSAADEIYVGMTLGTKICRSNEFVGCTAIRIYDDQVIFYRDGCAYQNNYRTGRSSSLTMHFEANPKTLQVSVRSASIACGERLVFIEYLTAESFRSARPCVLVAGPSKATIASGN